MRKFVIKVEGKSYEVEVEEITGGKASYSEESHAVNNYEPQVVEPIQTPKDNSGSSAKKSLNGDAVNVKAPMPGTILDIKVSEGESVEKGQIVCILEAMKMENEIVSPVSGTVAQISVAQGASVESDDTLFFIE
ncbi:MAG: biotin/lipoyl-binding protein [Clostridiales bacterium]|nr:biotin/lipoyl-binding protein [Clostridiales bacterium]